MLGVLTPLRHLHLHAALGTVLALLSGLGGQLLLKSWLDIVLDHFHRLLQGCILNNLCSYLLLILLDAGDLLLYGLQLIF